MTSKGSWKDAWICALERGRSPSPLELLATRVTDTNASAADTPVLANEAVSAGNEAGNLDSANATITMTMYALPDEVENG